MKSPATYGEWCALFDEMVSGVRDDQYIETVRSGSIAWSSGVAERFIRAASDMIAGRINKAQDMYKRQLAGSRGTPAGISTALHTLALEYRYVYRLAKALPIPQEYRDRMAELVRQQADQANKSLLDSAVSDRTGRLASLVRSAGVNRLE